MHLVPCLMILLSDSLNFSLCMVFFIGLAMGGRMFVGYVWMTEHMRIADVPKMTATLFFFDSLGIFVASIYFKHISKDWRFMFGFPAIILCGAIFACAMQTETPKFYYGIGKYDKAREILTIIGRTNGVLGPEQEYKKMFDKES